MTESEIHELEIAIGCRFPTSYRALLLDYPAALRQLAAMRGDDEPQEFYGSAASLLMANVDDADYRNSIFPSHYVIIGESGCGDYYAIDTSDDAAPVYMGGPHQAEYPQDAAGNPVPVQDSIQQYVDRVVADLSEAPAYEPPSKAREVAEIVSGIVLAPFMFLLLLLSLCLTVTLALLVRFWRPKGND